LQLQTSSEQRFGVSEHSELVGEVRTLLVDKLFIRVPSVHADLFDEGLLDSMGLIELVAQLEKRFSVKLPIGELGVDPFSSVLTIAQVVADRR
jgi:acyl carrier protein